MLVTKVPRVFVLLTIINCVKCNIQQNNASIIIIGAGSAGIAAATKLLEHNFTNIKILEAENRIGGRIHSVQFGEAYIDLGAEYCHGEKGNVVFSMASKFNLLKSTPLDYCLLSSNGEYLDHDLEEKLFNLAHLIKYRKEIIASEDDPCYNMLSVGECLDFNFKKLVSHEADAEKMKIIVDSYGWLKNYKSATENCLDLTDLSLVSNYEVCEGDQMLQWDGRGFITILDIMLKNYPEYKRELPIENNKFFNKKVLKINNWNTQTKVEVVCSDNKKYYADHVIFTPSLGVLKADFKTLFSPSLPKEKIEAIENIGFGAIVKIGLYFSSKWWLDGTIWGCVWTSDDENELNHRKHLWLRYFTAITNAPANPNVLMTWFVGKGVPEIETLSDSEVLDGISFLITKCFAKFNASAPDQISRSSWYSNPNFRGTYSYESVKNISSSDRTYQEKLGRPLSNKKGVPKVLFAGEATHLTRYSTVHGAIETGYREADRLIKFYGKNV